MLSERRIKMIDLEEAEQDGNDRETARQYVTGELTKVSIQILEFYTKNLGRNEALAVTIESVSETLGNLISLVKEEHQQEVVDSASVVIQQGLLSQQELIAELAYGQVGHA
jgi:hypothetical protein